MKIEEYLNNKAKAKAAREEEYKKHRNLCLSCFWPKQHCFCKEITSFSTQCTFRILMHPKEAKKERLGTGRFASICLSESKIIVDENFKDNIEVNRLINSDEYFPMILYPGDDSHNLSHADFPDNIKDQLSSKKLLIFVIDGTWTCAKSMMRDSSNLHHLPRVSFAPGVLSAFRIKQQPARYCLSTIESLYYLLRELEKWRYESLGDKAQVLLDTLEKLVDFQVECAKRPNPSRYRPGVYKDLGGRAYSKKWKKRRVYFQKSENKGG
jgi:DTW domain-containing protein YfiP